MEPQGKRVVARSVTVTRNGSTFVRHRRRRQLRRLEARARGEARYVSEKTCLVCGTSVRYTRRGECVQCKKNRNSARYERRPRKERHGSGGRRITNLARQKAKLAGERHYENNEPCKVCGTYLRYTHNYHCVHCKLDWDRTKRTPSKIARYNEYEAKRQRTRLKKLEFLRGQVERAWGFVYRGLRDGFDLDVMRRLISDWEYHSLQVDYHLGRHPYFNRPMLALLEQMEKQGEIEPVPYLEGSGEVIEKWKASEEKHETLLSLDYSSLAWQFG